MVISSPIPTRSVDHCTSYHMMVRIRRKGSCDFSPWAPAVWTFANVQRMSANPTTCRIVMIASLLRAHIPQLERMERHSSPHSERLLGLLNESCGIECPRHSPPPEIHEDTDEPG